MTRRAELPHNLPSAPGAFLPDGGWNPNGELRHRGETHRLIEAMCRERHFARLSPHEASLTIQASSLALAFPNWRQWDVCPDWAAAWTSTSAEEAVKRAGESIATEHHWCGAGKWLPGSQASCPDEQHRARRNPETVRRLIDSVLQGPEKAPPLPASSPEACHMESEPGGEEEGPEIASTEV